MHHQNVCGIDWYGDRASSPLGSTRCHWNDPGLAPPCAELAMPVVNAWPHTLGAYPLPALAGAQWSARGLDLSPPAFAAAADAEYTIFTPLVSAARAPGNASRCALAGHWAPVARAGEALSVRVRLAAADAARCSLVAVNGGAFQPARVVDGAVAIDAAPAGVPPVLTWEIA